MRLEDAGKVAGGCFHKEPEQLSDDERLALYFISGGAMEGCDTGLRAKHPFGIQKIDGKFRVCIAVNGESHE